MAVQILNTLFKSSWMAEINRPDFWQHKNDPEKIKKLYNDPMNLVVIEFANRTAIKKYIWIEPTCVSIEIEKNTEFQVITHDRTFRIEFDTEETIIFYLQYSFGFILNKRPTSNKIPNPHSWSLEIDCSDIN